MCSSSSTCPHVSKSMMISSAPHDAIENVLAQSSSSETGGSMAFAQCFRCQCFIVRVLKISRVCDAPKNIARMQGAKTLLWGTANPEGMLNYEWV